MQAKQLTKLKLPAKPGVYIFRDNKHRPLYIGRATSLKDRVRSYFAADLIATRGPRLVDMVAKGKTVTWQETGSVLEAILLENQLIKRYQPFYNVDERDDKSAQYVVITAETWPRVFLARARDLEQARTAGTLPYRIKKVFGPYPEAGLIKEALKILRKLFPFKDQRSNDPRHDAFYRSLGRSPEGDDSQAKIRYQHTVRQLIMFFEGRKDQLKKSLTREMNAAAKDLAFEEADRLKRLIYALDHIRDMALIKRAADDFELILGDSSSKEGGKPKRPDFRMEAYDIAHLSGTNVVGAMVVSTNGQLEPAAYRRFKLSNDRNDDLKGLAEILTRRLNHPEWNYPDLIVVDGDERHRRRAAEILSAGRLGIPVVAVTKDEKHRARKLLGDPAFTGKLSRQIIALNAEAHRFVIAYHRHKRRLKHW